MAYTRQYEYLSFDNVRAILYVRIQFFWDSVFYNNTRSFPIQLPVDSLGRVPTGSALEAYIDQVLNTVYSPESQEFKRNLIDVGGTVSNADAIFAITSDDEPSGVPQDGIPVIVYPVGGTTGFTSSVIALLYFGINEPQILNRFNPGTLPNPLLTIPEYNPDEPDAYYGPNAFIDWGFGGPEDQSQLINIIGNTNTGPSNSVLITGEDNNSLIPQEVFDDFPYLAQHPDADGSGNYNAFVYVNHAPMTINGTYGLGYFIYGS
jgi:hypothetical protein